MSGVVHNLEIDVPDEEEVDPVTEWFLESGPTDSLVIHHHTCPVNEDERRLCDCVPVTLVRGATA